MSERASPSSDRCLLTALCLVLLLGTGLRLQRYWLRVPFWRDEAFIVINVRALSPGQLFGPLRYDQAAPPGFLLLEHAMARLLGDGELSMRAVPLVSGIAAMLVVTGLAWRRLGLQAAIFAAGLMAFCQNLIEYCAEVKQYSGDACAAAILLAIAIGSNGSPARRLGRSAIAASLLVWFSHPTSIVFAGISTLLSVATITGLFNRHTEENDGEPARRPKRGALGAIAGVVAANALFAASFLVLYRLSIRQEHTDFLYSFWGGSFPDWSHPLSLPGWFIRQTSQWLNFGYHGAGYVLLVLAAMAAPMRMERRWAQAWLMAAAPLALTALAACARQYPYGGSRLTLFTLPGFFLLAAAGGEQVRRLLPSHLRMLWWLLPGPVLVYGLALGIVRAAEPQYHSYIRPAVAYLRQHRAPGEPIYCLGEPERNRPSSIWEGRHIEILCYWPQPPGKVVTVVRSAGQLTGERFWVLIPFATQDGEPALQKAMKLLAPLGMPIDSFIEPRGGAAVQFQRNGPNTPPTPD